MNDSKLKATLQPIVQEYGLGAVLRSLGELADDHKFESNGRLATSVDGLTSKSKGRRQKITAPEYVKKLEFSSEKSVAIAELAERFQQKSFLPTFGDIVHFCEVHGIEVPASKSRASAIPRVFKHLAEMQSEDIRQILDYHLFSGPSMLGPIADAIRNYSRVAS